MRLRGKHRNKIHYPDIVRNLTKEQIAPLLDKGGLSGILKSLNIPNYDFHRRLLRCKLEDFGLKTKKIGTRLIDLTGLIFGHLKVIERIENSKSGNPMWLCEEIGTGIRKPVFGGHLRRGNTKSFTYKKKGSEHHQWTGCGLISGDHFGAIKRGALKRLLEFSISIEYIWNLYLKQDRKCALSGVDIYFPETNKCPHTASLDRIDSSKGYTEGNIQWVHKDINIMKNIFPQEKFINYCIMISEKNKNLSI